MKRFIIKTFGCKTNQYETEGIREALMLTDWHETDNISQADIAIINTCSVTSRAGASARNTIRKIKKFNPHIRFIITGCAIDTAEEWLKELDIEAQFKNTQKYLIADYLNGLIHSDLTTLETGDGFEFSLNGFAGHTRAFLKIQDGCDNFCSYCIIPYARGKPRSRDINNIIAEASRLGHNGYKEIVLTGISIGAYNFQDNDLTDLLLQLNKITDIKRIRLGSVEPNFLTEKLLKTIADCEKICSHLHLPLQSGSNSVLKAMNRKYTTKTFLNLVEQSRKIIDKPAITTDIIVGFPTENEISFRETMATIKQANFSRSHIFLFSARDGTPAAKMKSPPQREADQRRRELEELSEKQAQDYSQSLIGFNNEKIMIEKTIDNTAYGYLERYIRCEVPLITQQKIQKGKLYSINIEKLQNKDNRTTSIINSENTLLCSFKEYSSNQTL